MTNLPVFCLFVPPPLPLAPHPSSRKPPGFAFIEMEDRRDAEDACKELDGTRLCGNRVKVMLPFLVPSFFYCVVQVELSNGGKGGRGGSGGGARGRSRSPGGMRGGRGGGGSPPRGRGGRSRSRSGGRKRSRSPRRERARRSPSYRSMSRGREAGSRSRSPAPARKRPASRSRDRWGLGNPPILDGVQFLEKNLLQYCNFQTFSLKLI